jgi:hypothetical protein
VLELICGQNTSQTLKINKWRSGYPAQPVELNLLLRARISKCAGLRYRRETVKAS